MRQNGRKSAASLAVARPAVPESRLAAPVYLSDAERSVWLEMVNSEPANSFTATHIPLIETYCRHIVRSRVLADAIDNFDPAWLNDPDGLARYDKLLAMAEREGRAASSLATRLRITRQAQHDPKTVGRAARLSASSSAKKPWELAGAND